MLTGARCTIVAAAAILATASALGCSESGPDTSSDNAFGPVGSANLVMISLDTTRAEHLSPYGYGRDTTPAIRALATRSTLFDRAFAQDTNTNPSHASMFTGLYPHRHGNVSNLHRLADEKITLAEILSDAGFRCGGFVSGITLSRTYRLHQGFEVWDDEGLDKKLRRRGKRTVERALDWLSGLQPGERYFLFVHLYDAHGPYKAPPAYRNLFASASPGPPLREFPDRQSQPDRDGRRATTLHPYMDVYDANLRYMDDLVARLIDAIDLDHTVVLVLADHGETMAERYWGLDHGGQAFEEQIRIPMILYLPEQAPNRIDALVETVDLLPTLLDLLGVAPRKGIETDGYSLLGLITGKTESVRSVVFSAARPEEQRHLDRGYHLDRSRRIHCVRSLRWKLILYPGVHRDYVELYDLERDPLETVDVGDEHPKLRDHLEQRLKGWLAGARIEPAPRVSPEEAEALKSLGYL